MLYINSDLAELDKRFFDFFHWFSKIITRSKQIETVKVIWPTNKPDRYFEPKNVFAIPLKSLKSCGCYRGIIITLTPEQSCFHTLCSLIQ